MFNQSLTNRKFSDAFWSACCPNAKVDLGNSELESVDKLTKSGCLAIPKYSNLFSEPRLFHQTDWTSKNSTFCHFNSESYTLFETIQNEIESCFYRAFGRSSASLMRSLKKESSKTSLPFQPDEFDSMSLTWLVQLGKLAFAKIKLEASNLSFSEEARNELKIKFSNRCSRL